VNRSVLWAALQDEDGVTAAEYAMMLVLVIVGVISAVNAVGGTTAGGWSNNVNQIQSASSAAAS
jgi:Flp pilus assembly pilin Flp